MGRSSRSPEVNAAIIAAIAAIVVAFIGLYPNIIDNFSRENPKLKITNIQLLDETYTEQTSSVGTVLNNLIPRSTTEFRYSQPTDFKIAFLFTLEDYKTQNQSQTDIDGTIKIEDLNDQKLAEGPLHHTSKITDWRNRPSVRTIGLENVIEYLNLPSESSPKAPIPFLVVLNQFEQDEIPEGDAKVVISMNDGLSKQEANEEFRIRVIKN